MNEEQLYKKEALLNGLAHINMQNNAAIIELLENIDETWKARSEESFFDKALAAIDNGWGAVGEKLGHDNISGHEVQSENGARLFFNEKSEILNRCDGEPVLDVKPVAKDWSKATLEDVPVDWMPEFGEVAWYIHKDSVLSYISFERSTGIFRLFPTERLAQMYVDSQKPVERWKPEVNKWYWKLRETGIPLQFKWAGTKVDWDYYHFGNCFRTEQEALAARDRVKKALKGE